MKHIPQLILLFFALQGYVPGFCQTMRDSITTVVMATELGEIQVDLYLQQAPITTANFLKYVRRAADQGGSFYRTVTMANQPDKKIKIEVIQGGFTLEGIDSASIQPIPLERTNHTGVRHKNGTISMARSDPDSGSTEFFICIGDQPSLDYGGMRNPDGQGFAAFGTVTTGMDIVQRIQNSPANGQSLTPPVRILSFKEIRH
jgi:peptidyl-prolyl cis-trans isomerase A (cyclophilin A)